MAVRVYTEWEPVSTLRGWKQKGPNCYWNKLADKTPLHSLLHILTSLLHIPNVHHSTNDVIRTIQQYLEADLE